MAEGEWVKGLRLAHRGPGKAARPFALLAVLLLGWLALPAQNSHILHIRLQDADRLPQGFKAPGNLRQASEAGPALERLLLDLRADGYLQAAAELIASGPDSSSASLFLGPRMRWINLRQGNLDDAALRASGFRERQFRGQPIRPSEVVRISERLLRHAENTGFPFAELRLDSFRFTPDGVEAGLYLDRYRFLALDTIRVPDGLRLSPAYLRRYLGLREGQPYNEMAIRAAPDRIRELNFLRETQPPLVEFYGDRAVLGLFLEEVNANQFDLLIGVLPNSAITGRLALTGEGNLQLFNTLGIGEELRLIYRRLQAGTQELNLNLVFPYLPLVPLGAHLDFDLYLRDSTFLERGTDFGLRYPLVGSDYIEGFWQNERYVLLNPDTALIRLTRSLPQNLDVAVNRYGIAVQRERLDYRYNPRRGWSLFFRGSAGSRNVLINNTIASISDPLEPEFDYAALYDSVSGSQASFQLGGRAAWFQPLGARSVWHMGWQGGWLQGGVLLQNELHRLGGYRRLRGFDEESIFASHYHILTLEYRFLLAQNSRFSLFSDLAWLEEKRLGMDRRDRPIGFGAGLDFETSAGIFGLSYALGRQRGNPIVFREAKIHFGYINRF
jgi:outer membrane protein assembly factor BamA